MLSSYLIAHSSCVIKGSALAGLKQFSKKLRRLWPTYFVSIIIIFTITRFVNLPGRNVGITDFIANIFWVNQYFGLSYVDGSHWYIGVLLSTSFVIILFQVFGIERKVAPYLIWLIFTCSMEKMIGTGAMYLFGGPFVGCVCGGIAIRNIQVGEAQKKYHWCGLFFVAIAITYMLRGTIPAVELLAVAPIIYMSGIGKLKILDNPVLIFAGEISYSLYLIHQNISFIILNELVKMFGKYNIAFSIATFFLVIAVGALLYYSVEKPLQYVSVKNKVQ